MGCGCLPSCWPLCKVFESNSKISGNLIEPTSLPFWTETKGVTRHSYCIQRGQLSVRGGIIHIESELLTLTQLADI